MKEFGLKKKIFDKIKAMRIETTFPYMALVYV